MKSTEQEKHGRFSRGLAGWARHVAVLVALALGLSLALAALGCSDDVSKADALVGRGDPAGAEALYRAALASNPDDLKALDGLAVALTLQHENDEALPIQERVVAADPKDAQTRIELGFNYLNYQHRSADAVRVLGEAVAIDGSAKARTFLAQAQIAVGNSDAAEKTLREAIALDPAYGHSYVVLVALLRDEGRTADVEALLQQAAAHGVAVADGQ